VADVTEATDPCPKDSALMEARFPRRVAIFATLAAVYFVAAKLGLKLAFVHASATPVWPPTGIALAAFLSIGYQVWPGIFLGAFLANLTTAGSVATSIGIGLGNTLEGLVGAYLVNRFANGCAASPPSSRGFFDVEQRRTHPRPMNLGEARQRA